jgi:hypothetical protein
MVGWYANDELRRILEGSGRSLIEMLYRKLPGETGKPHQQPQVIVAGVPKKIQTYTSRIQIYNATATVTCWLLGHLLANYVL